VDEVISRRRLCQLRRDASFIAKGARPTSKRSSSATAGAGVRPIDLMTNREGITKACLPEQMFACLDAALELVQAAWRRCRFKRQSTRPTGDATGQFEADRRRAGSYSPDIGTEARERGRGWNEWGSTQRNAKAEVSSGLQVEFRVQSSTGPGLVAVPADCVLMK
jgi:hypothetical protein